MTPKGVHRLAGCSATAPTASQIPKLARKQHLQNIVLHHEIEETITCKENHSTSPIKPPILTLLPVPMMEPEFKTDVPEEHGAFTGTVHQLDEYLKTVLGVRQGRKNGQLIPDPGVPKEALSAATIKGSLEEMANPFFTHVNFAIPSQAICVCHAKTCYNDVSYHSASMKPNSWIPRHSGPGASPRRGSERSKTD